MKIRILLMAVVLAGLLFSLSASAVVTAPSCGVVPIQQLNYITSTQVDKFDPSLGQLQSVTVTVDACGRGSRTLKNEDQIPTGVDYTAILTANMVTDIPGIGSQNFQIGTTEDFHLDPNETYTITLAPACDSDSITLTTPAEMAPYIGAGQKVTIPVSTNSKIEVDGSTEWTSTGSTFMGVTVCVVYEYQLPLLCINGTKINDCTDLGIPGWQICLTNPAGQTVCKTTDANGDYSFCGLAPGAYKVSEETRADWTPVGPTSIDVALGADDVDGVDFLNAPLVCISGHKFNSKTNAGLSGWTIQLKKDGAVIKTTTTGTGGVYQFCDLVPGSYTVSEVQKSGWKAVGPTSIDVQVAGCDNSEDNDFYNEPSNLVCVCPFFIKNELYTANCNAIKTVDATKGILANDPPGSIVLNPESIKIDARYGTISVEQDGSFEYDPTGATARLNGLYVMFNYRANNGLCDSVYQGIAKIQVTCK